jgi:acetyltransferase-like isoleucine patch superfamily enzyme
MGRQSASLTRPDPGRIEQMTHPASLAFAEIGEDVTIYPLAKIIGPGRIRIGSHVVIDDFVFIGSHQELILGNHVHLASHASISGGGICVCCDFSGVSSGARILTGTDDFRGAGLTGPTVPDRYRAVQRGKTVIGAHAVIGANSVVCPNVTVGEGCTVGAGAVVTRDLEPWGIYVGAPARKIGIRRCQEILDFEIRLAAEENLLTRFRTAEALGNPLTGGPT